MSQEATSACCCADLRNLLSPDFFRALGDPRRVAIVVSLAQGCRPRTVSDVCTCCDVDMSVVSRHLATLRAAGIVAAARRGKQVYYSVRFGHLARLLHQLGDAIQNCCPEVDQETTRGEKPETTAPERSTT